MSAVLEFSQNIVEYMLALGESARSASRIVAASTTGQRNNALLAMADSLEANASSLQAENRKDLEAGRAKGLDAALLDRLELTREGIAGMAEGLRQIATLPDPVGNNFKKSVTKLTGSSCNFRPPQNGNQPSIHSH